MALDKIIHQHQPYSEAGQHDHTGMRSHRRGLESSSEQIKEWTIVDFQRQKMAAVEAGHTIPDQFWSPEVDRLAEIRAELRVMCE